MALHLKPAWRERSKKIEGSVRVVQQCVRFNPDVHVLPVQPYALVYGHDVRTHVSVGPMGNFRLVPMGRGRDPFTGLLPEELARRRSHFWNPDPHKRVKILNGVIMNGSK